MNAKKLLYNLKLFCSLLKYFALPIWILSKYPNSLAKNEVCFENNKISVRLNKIAELYKSAGDKPYNSIRELLKVGLLELEECPDKNFYKITYTKGNFQKYLKSCGITRKKEKKYEKICITIYSTKK